MLGALFLLLVPLMFLMKKAPPHALDPAAMH
jgi:hypothetical protein